MGPLQPMITSGGTTPAALVLLASWCACAATVTAGACSSSDLAKANVILELCFDDEVNGISVAHTHGLYKLDVKIQEPDMSQCVTNANAM